MTPLLSICIPTYKRPNLLRELLESIADQQHENVEVLVSDDRSEDETPLVVESFSSRIKHLRLLRQPNNLGLDLNFIELVKEANGDYVWFVGDDDKVEPDAISTVLKSLEEWPNVGGLTLGVIDYDSEFRLPVGVRVTPPTMQLTGTEVIFARIVHLLGFISSLVVNRRMWLLVCEQDPVLNFRNLYIQVYISGRIMDRGYAWGVVHTPCVGFRTDNDQFFSRLGWIERTRVDITAYDQIANELFAAKPSSIRLMQTNVIKSHILARILNDKTNEASNTNVREAGLLLFKYYKHLPIFWYLLLPIIVIPKPILREARLLYQRFAPKSGKRRATRLMSDIEINRRLDNLS